MSFLQIYCNNKQIGRIPNWLNCASFSLCQLASILEWKDYTEGAALSKIAANNDRAALLLHRLFHYC
jgi:hypothetical protein